MGQVRSVGLLALILNELDTRAGLAHVKLFPFVQLDHQRVADEGGVLRVMFSITLIASHLQYLL